MAGSSGGICAPVPGHEKLNVIGAIAVLLVSETVVEAGEIKGSPLSMVMSIVAVSETPESLTQRV
jgi:hypothetical protein